MSVYATSLLPTKEVIAMILSKYQVESEADQFALYVIKESGGKSGERSIAHHQFQFGI